MKRIAPVLMAVIAVLLVGFLVRALMGLAKAEGEALLLAAQLEDAKVEIVELTTAREEAEANSDSVGAFADSVQQASDAVIAGSRATASRAEAAGDSAFADAMEVLGDSLPALRTAIMRMKTEHDIEKFAWDQERDAHESAADALRLQVSALTVELGSWQAENEGLREALALSEQEADSWERAAKPGTLRQIWEQGRVAVVVAAVVLAVR